MNTNATIMIVDDNLINLKLVSDLLDLEGFKVLRCTDAETALTTLSQVLPDLILMDIALPGMDGIELTQKLKTDQRTANIKVVALTSFAMKGDRERMMDARCDGYITKPIDTRKFMDQISHYL